MLDCLVKARPIDTHASSLGDLTFSFWKNSFCKMIDNILIRSVAHVCCFHYFLQFSNAMWCGFTGLRLENNQKLSKRCHRNIEQKTTAYPSSLGKYLSRGFYLHGMTLFKITLPDLPFSGSLSLLQCGVRDVANCHPSVDRQPNLFVTVVGAEWASTLRSTGNKQTIWNFLFIISKV